MEPPQTLAPATVLAYVLANLAIILVAARAVGWVFARFGQPRVVGEIIAGILIGPTILGGALAKAPLPGTPAVDGSGITNWLYPLQSFSFLNLIGQVGLVLFMFLVGLELDQRLLKGRGRQIAIMALAVTVAPIGFGFLVGAVLDSTTWRPEGVSSTTFALFLGAALSVTAFPVMARILQEKGLITRPMGAVGVGSAAVVTVLMFLTIAGASASAKGSGVIGDVGAKVGWTVGLIVALFAGVRPALNLLVKRWEPGKPVDEILAVCLALALGTALAADRIGISALVGGFLLGAAVPARKELAEAMILRLTSPVVLFFLPVFLAVSGLRTNLRLLDSGDLIPGLLLFLALMIVGKWGIGYVAGRAVGLTSNQANIIGVLLNCRGLLILVVGLIGLQLGVITPTMQVVFVLGAIVTTLMTGPLVDRFVKREEADPEADRKASGVALLSGELDLRRPTP